MVKGIDIINVYLESGSKRVFAGAIDWPGWCRSGGDKAEALQGLIESAPRYAGILQAAGIDFHPPEGMGELAVVEQLAGGAGTDFGAPEAAPSADERPLGADELRRMQAILSACWDGFDRAVEAADGKELRKGPRGGGRDLDKIIEHVSSAEASYLSRLGVRFKPEQEASPLQQMMRIRKAIQDGLSASARGELPKVGPRGGKIWSPCYFVRRAAWHVLDHLWEIEDRLLD